MKRGIGYVLMIIVVALVTFFGLGPILFADGTIGERGVTFLVVLIIYLLLFFAWRTWLRK
ncbi:hypothetical protein KDJ56_10685 [Brevibacillus composti]|uniref:Uncharacterized protein n=1 Tax=Brevibacillus composti TaxID=2796470 RepID=A0A7T5EPF6_9BACL|nr:hypothetical protein [Brevibacillus composti]QQE76344.1 hypothetical protein JD108_11000 [Brevibacillus composti]QUO43371.1 hypothetical protein KDJ56_10685 [Brevibacillus composti]